MRVILLSFLLTSCITTRETITLVDSPETDGLKKSISRLSYMIQSDFCFTSYAVCLGEKKILAKECYSRHEKCVINTDSQWRKLIE